MAASPELRRPPSPAGFNLVLFLGDPLAEEDRDLTRTSAAPEAEAEGGGAGVGCRTPSSKGSKIPPIDSCPPPPRKARHVGASATCKRRLSGLELFRVGPELMGLLFQPLDSHGAAACLPPPASPAAKRRKGCGQKG